VRDPTCGDSGDCADEQRAESEELHLELSLEHNFNEK
jgi:hypothetical protein